MRSLRLAFRTLFKTPFITAVAVLSLSLGIGANSAIFSLFNQMLLTPLPVPRPVDLVNLGAPGPKPGSNSCSNAGPCEVVFSYPMFRDLERAQTSFTGIAAHRSFGANLAYKGDTRSGRGILVSGGYFQVLGVNPAAGRLLTKDDDTGVSSHFVAVISNDYWRTRFAEDPAVLNAPLAINGHDFTIVGIGPRGFTGTTLGLLPDVFVPISMRAMIEPTFKAESFENRRSYWVYLFARLAPGITIEQARTALNGPYKSIINDVEVPLQKGMSEQTMSRFKAKEVTMEAGQGGQTSVRAEARAPLIILLAVTGTVLLIACANIANLLLARGAGRAAEMAVRLSIGASRRQLVTQLLVESCVLAGMGAAFGLLVAKWTLDLIQSIIPAEAAALVQFRLDGDMLVFAAALAIATGVAFGLFPALHSTRPDLAATLKNQAGQPGGAKAARRFRTALATVQIALSMALLVPAGLFAKSLFNVSRVNLGLDADSLVTFGISPELNGYPLERSRQLFERVVDELGAVPGVTGAVGAMVPVLAGDNWTNSLTVEGFQAGPDTNTSAAFNGVTPGFFQTMGIPVLAGREFTRADTATGPKVAVVNQVFAKKFNLGDNPVGKRFKLGGDADPFDIEIVGLARDAKYSEVKREIPAQYFLPQVQGEPAGWSYFYVRTALPTDQMLAAIPGIVKKLDPSLPVENLKTMEMQVRENVFLDRLISTMSVAFALLATLLAAVGLYGVLAYTVAQRTREIGLRMALGADGASVRGLIMRQVAWMAVIGGAVGLLAAVGIGRLAQSLLFEMQGFDPAVFAASAFTLTLVALGAGFLPALWASQIDPMAALRYE
jgi:predicted permease